MRRFLITAGVNGHPQALERLQTQVHELKPDGLLFAGGVFAQSAEDIAKFVCGCDYYTEQGSLFMEQFFATLGSFGVYCAVIPGMFDAPLDDFVKHGMAAERRHANIHIVHVTPAIQGDVAIFGLGGCICEQTSANTGSYSRALAEYYLRPLLTCKLPQKIVLVSDPPETWHGEPSNARLGDSLLCAYHPQVCVAGKQPGFKKSIERDGETLLIHPGELCKGCAAWLDLDRPLDDQAKLLHF